MPDDEFGEEGELDMMGMEEDGEFEVGDEDGELEQMAMEQLAAGMDEDDSEEMDYDQQLVEDISDENDSEPQPVMTAKSKAKQ